MTSSVDDIDSMRRPPAQFLARRLRARRLVAKRPLATAAVLCSLLCVVAYLVLVAQFFGNAMGGCGGG